MGSKGDAGYVAVKGHRTRYDVVGTVVMGENHGLLGMCFPEYTD